MIIHYLIITSIIIWFIFLRNYINSDRYINKYNRKHILEGYNPERMKADIKYIIEDPFRNTILLNKNSSTLNVNLSAKIKLDLGTKMPKICF